MKELTKVFKNAVSDLCCIDWSETDGTDVKKILKSAFTSWKSHIPEIAVMFDNVSGLNKFQKSMIKSLLIAI